MDVTTRRRGCVVVPVCIFGFATLVASAARILPRKLRLTHFVYVVTPVRSVPVGPDCKSGPGRGCVWPPDRIHPTVVADPKNEWGVPYSALQMLNRRASPYLTSEYTWTGANIGLGVIPSLWESTACLACSTSIVFKGPRGAPPRSHSFFLTII